MKGGSDDNGSQDFNRCSGSVDSFNNEKGQQDLSDAKIYSSRVILSFNNTGSGLQTLTNSEIHCVDNSDQRRGFSGERNASDDSFPTLNDLLSLIFTGITTVLDWKNWKQNHVDSGIVLCFNNNGNSQNLDGFQLNIEHMSKQVEKLNSINGRESYDSRKVKNWAASSSGKDMEKSQSKSMPRGSNDEPKNKNFTQHDKHNRKGDHSLNTSTTTASSQSQQCHVTSNSSVPDTSSTIVDSFNNYENGSQDFSKSSIKSRTSENSFNNRSSRSQSFRSACVEIYCGNKPGRISSESNANDNHRTLPLRSFFAKENGSQMLDGASLNGRPMR